MCNVNGPAASKIDLAHISLTAYLKLAYTRPSAAPLWRMAQRALSKHDMERSTSPSLPPIVQRLPAFPTKSSNDTRMLTVNDAGR